MLFNSTLKISITSLLSILLIYSNALAFHKNGEIKQVYENEEGLGLSLAESLSDQNISRKNIFITSKVFSLLLREILSFVSNSHI